ncbi:MAG: NAD(P)/FAD-dependent oxidoreductase [Pseudomonadota bacterium]
MTIKTDVVIVGAGPCGLFQVFELGLLDIKAHLIDSMSVPGGQCAELYPDKPIYDIPAYPVIDAQELVDNLMAQIKPFDPVFHLGQEVHTVNAREDGRFDVISAAGTHLDAGAVVIAGGVGAFRPKKLKVAGAEALEDSQLHYAVRDPSRFDGKRLLILGGGDSALDWANELAGRAAEITLMHRRTNYRAQPASVAKMRELVEAGRVRELPGQVTGFEYDEAGRMVAAETLDLDRQKGRLELDELLVFWGLSPKLGPIAEWGLSLSKNQIDVDTEKFESSTPGIYAVGDINTYPGKKKLILCGFHEAALAAFAIKARLYPEEKIHLQYTTTSSAMQERLGVK